MREILFRGKRIDNGEWVYGDLWHFGKDVLISPKNMYDRYEVIPETVGQFTGLLDKKGVRIFEGDIIRKWICGEGRSNYLVHYVNCGFRLKPIKADKAASVIKEQYGDGFLLKTFDDREIDFEIIGNIHDNPELLEVNNA